MKATPFWCCLDSRHGKVRHDDDCGKYFVATVWRRNRCLDRLVATRSAPLLYRGGDPLRYCSVPHRRFCGISVRQRTDRYAPVGRIEDYGHESGKFSLGDPGGTLVGRHTRFARDQLFSCLLFDFSYFFISLKT